MRFNQMGDDLGVGAGIKAVAFFAQPLPQFLIVLDDAVMDNGDFVLAVRVRMGVFLRNAPVRGPAAMRHAYAAVHFGQLYFSIDFFYLPDVFLDLQPLFRNRSYAG